MQIYAKKDNTEFQIKQQILFSLESNRIKRLLLR